MLLRLFLVLCLVSDISGCGGGNSESPPVTEIAFTTIEKRDSGIANGRQVVIRDSTAWSVLWAQHTSNMYSPTPLPTVDFNTNMVLAVFLGNSPNSCYTVEIRRVFQLGSDMYIEYHEAVPSPSLPIACAQYIATPSHIVTVPSSAANAVFIKS